MQFHQCKYCDKLYQSEARFLKHKCKERERYDTVKTLTGQIAYNFFCMWYTKRFFTNTISIETFITSSHFNAFIKFAEFVRKIKSLADSDLFIQLMVANKIQPNLWRDDRVFKKYLEFIERESTVEFKINISIKTLEQLADTYQCELADIFNFVHPNTLMQKIREQKLSPWLLLNSRKFLCYFEGLNSEQQSFLEVLVDPVSWKTQFLTKRKQTITIKKCLSALGL